MVAVENQLGENRLRSQQPLRQAAVCGSFQLNHCELTVGIKQLPEGFHISRRGGLVQGDTQLLLIDYPQVDSLRQRFAMNVGGL